MGRLSAAAMIVLAIPALAAAQHRRGAAGPAISMPIHSGTVISHAASGAAHSTMRVQSGAQGATRIGAPVLRTQNNGVRIIRRNNSNSIGFNDIDFQDVPGLGFDFPHLAAVSGHRRLHSSRFGSGVPFGFGGFLLGPSVIVEEVPAAESQPTVVEEEVADDTPEAQLVPRNARASRAANEPKAESGAAPQPDPEQFVFVRRDGGLVFAVAYAWENGTLRYVTPEGLRRSVSRDALDLNATQQFNEQRGLNFRVPA